MVMILKSLKCTRNLSRQMKIPIYISTEFGLHCNFSLESRPDILILHIEIVLYFNEKLHIIVVET